MKNYSLSSREYESFLTETILIRSPSITNQLDNMDLFPLRPNLLRSEMGRVPGLSKHTSGSLITIDTPAAIPIMLPT